MMLQLLDIRRQRAVDPTHTLQLRRQFRNVAQLNLNRLRTQLRQAVTDFNILGLDGGEQNPYRSRADSIKQFSGWLETAANANLDARWWATPYLDQAIGSGVRAATSELGQAQMPVPPSFAELHELASHELRGIIAALVQKLVRVADQSIAMRASPSRALHALTGPMDREIKPRLLAFANTYIVKAHNKGKIETYRANGIRRVGLDAELRGKLRCDAIVSFHDDDDDDMVGWLTAGDDDVCPDCEEYAEDSPYTLDEADALMPVHPNCRCSVYPWDDARFSGDADTTGHPFHGNQYTQGESGGTDRKASIAEHTTINTKLIAALRGAVPELQQFKSRMPGKYDDKHSWVLASTEAGGSGNPVTIPGHRSATGIALKINPASKHIYFSELNSHIHGAGAQMVSAVMRATPEYKYSATDLSQVGQEIRNGPSFWEKIKQQNPGRFVDSLWDEDVGHPFRGNQYAEGESGDNEQHTSHVNFAKAAQIRNAVKARSSYEFVSPSVASHLNFGQAVEAISGSQQQALRSASADINTALGLSADSHDIVGAWQDGAENSLMDHVGNSDWDKLKLSAAMKGYLADQKQVLVFQEQPDGQAVLAHFEAEGSLADIHSGLLQDGVAFHTLVPHAGGATVYVADLDGSQLDHIKKAAARYDAEIGIKFGRAQFLGTEKQDGSDREQRDDARQIYAGIIQQSQVQGHDEIWRRVRDRWGQAIHPAEVDAHGGTASDGARLGRDAFLIGNPSDFTKPKD